MAGPLADAEYSSQHSRGIYWFSSACRPMKGIFPRTPSCGRTCGAPVERLRSGHALRLLSRDDEGHCDEGPRGPPWRRSATRWTRRGLVLGCCGGNHVVSAQRCTDYCASKRRDEHRNGGSAQRIWHACAPEITVRGDGPAVPKAFADPTLSFILNQEWLCSLARCFHVARMMLVARSGLPHISRRGVPFSQWRALWRLPEVRSEVSGGKLNRPASKLAELGSAGLQPGGALRPYRTL